MASGLVPKTSMIFFKLDPTFPGSAGYPVAERITDSISPHPLPLLRATEC